jgi:hypothetical protein
MARTVTALHVVLLFLSLLLPHHVRGEENRCRSASCEELASALAVSMDDVVAAMRGHLDVGLEEADIQKDPNGNYYLMGFERDERDHRLVFHEVMSEKELEDLRRSYWARRLGAAEKKSAYLGLVECAVELRCLAALEVLIRQFHGNGLVEVAAAAARLDYDRGRPLLKEALRDEKRQQAAINALTAIARERAAAAKKPAE